MNLETYAEAGVNVELGDRFTERLKALVKRPGHAQLKPAAGGYAAVYPFTPTQWMALTTDGVGTKVLLAQQFQQMNTIGVDLVAMCANDLICVGATPSAFLDYYATGKLTLENGLAFIEGVAKGCDEARMLLVGGETAEMPDVYQDGHFDVAGFAVGSVTEGTLLTGKAIQPGQIIIGLASSGIHSNGLSLARKILTQDNDLAELLTPTRLYVEAFLAIQHKFPKAITGLAHITGGGYRNLFRLNDTVGYYFNRPNTPQRLFEKIMSAGISPTEMVKTFNMGMGLAMIVQSDADAIVKALNALSYEATIVGEVTDQAGVIKLPCYDVTLTQ